MSARKINDWAMPYVKQHRRYIDIGANVGHTCMPFIGKFENIVAFEPHPDCFEILRQQPAIVALNFALLDEEKIVQLKLHKNSVDKPEHGSIAPRRNKDWDGKILDVYGTTLDSFNFEDVDFIKVDVEQGELEVIKGSLKTIEKCKPVIMFENKRNENDSVIDILTQQGYKIKKYKSDTVAFIEEK